MEKLEMYKRLSKEDKLNLTIYKCEKNRNNSFVVGREEDLNRLLKLIEDDESWMYVNGNRIEFK